MNKGVKQVVGNVNSTISLFKTDSELSLFNAKKVTKVAVELDRCLLETYEDMLPTDIADDVHEIFQSLLDR